MFQALFTFPQSVGIAGGRPSSSYYFVASQASSLFYLDPHLTRPAVILKVPPRSTRTGANHLKAQTFAESRDEDTDTPYTLDVVDVDDLSGSEDSAASSPTAQVKRKRMSLPPPVPPISVKTPDELPNDPFSLHNANTPAPVGYSSRYHGEGHRKTMDIDPETRWWVEAYPPEATRTFHCERVKKMPLAGLDPSMLLGFLCKNEADFKDFVDRVGKVSICLPALPSSFYLLLSFWYEDELLTLACGSYHKRSLRFKTNQ